MSEDLQPQEQLAAPEDISGEIAPESAAGDNEPQPPEETPRPHKGGFQRRIDKLTREKSDAERAAEFWRTEALRTRQDPAAVNDGKPSPDHFETQAGYLEALTDWKVEQRERAHEARHQQQQEVHRRQAQQDNFLAREDGFRDAAPDYDAVIAQAIASDTPMSPALWTEVQDHEHGPALLYYLAQNPADAERLAAMSSNQVAREIGRLEARFVPSADTPRQQRAAAPVTRAPKPPSLVGRSTRTSEKDPFSDDMSPEEWRTYRAKQFPNLR
ncbi:hypothetical protein AB4Y89_21595 [Terriglobus sp. 2YAB30_2]|uniref:hypothetical protein n=1 Tax=unclassified Terriglobus TaxID=2628988 RepID=UPI003F9E5BB2